MLDISKLITDLKSELPNEWTVEDALSMELVDAKDLPSKVPLITLYQDDEVYSEPSGSPCVQSVDSGITFVVVCKTAELKDRMKVIRDALRGWQGDEDYHSIYRKIYGRSAGRVGVNATYTWWKENWETNYKV